jgi:hypothetical protein
MLHHLRIEARFALARDELHHVRRRHLDRLLANDLEEHFRSDAAASTVFGRPLAATNSRCRSNCGWPSVTGFSVPFRAVNAVVLSSHCPSV